MITGTTAAMLRSGVTRSCALQPILLRSSTTVTTTACPYSTLPASSSSRLSVRPKLAGLPTAVPFSTKTRRPSPVLVLRRAPQAPAGAAPSARRPAATSTNAPSTNAHDQDAAAAARAAQRTATLGPDTPTLDWNTFFQLRKARRRWQVGFSVVLSLASGTGGAMLLSTGAADSLTSQVPLDPILTLGLMTIGFVALGWLAGPSLGSAVFYLIKRKYKLPMTVKESQFFARIKKNRVDPSNSSTGNPVPDFYGEKISSVAGYRQWLKDQRAYNKKRTTFI